MWERSIHGQNNNLHGSVNPGIPNKEQVAQEILSVLKMIGTGLSSMVHGCSFCTMLGPDVGWFEQFSFNPNFKKKKKKKKKKRTHASLLLRDYIFSYIGGVGNVQHLNPSPMKC